MEENFQKTLFVELGKLLEPLASAASSPELRDQVLSDLGWDADGIEGFPIESLNDALHDFESALEHFRELTQDPAPEDLKALADGLLAAGFTIRAVIELNAVFQSSGTSEGLKRLGNELVDYLVVSYFAAHHAIAFHVLYLLTVIDDVFPDPEVSSTGDIVRAPRIRQTLRLAQIPALLSDPVGTLKTEYFLEDGITEPQLTSDKLFARLLFFAKMTGASAAYGVHPDDLATFDFGAAGSEIAKRTLTVFWPFPDDDDTRAVGAGTSIYLSPELGVVLRPMGTFELSGFFGRWQVDLEAALQAQAVAVSSEGVQIPSAAPGGIEVLLGVTRLPDDDGSSRPLAFKLGSATGTRLEVTELSGQLQLKFQPGGLEYGFEITVEGARFVISSGDGDGFVREVLPAEFPISLDFTFGWSNLRGLHFSGSAGLDVVLPVHVSLGSVLDIESIELGIRTDLSKVDLLATATFTAHLGSVIDVTAQRTGLKGLLTFPPDNDGNLGPANFDLGFQLPRGLGIVVHAGPVTGGGFIFLDPDIGRYSGALELSVFSVGVKAFGIVDTKFPDGTEGFSFIIVIVAEFTPIQLGFGFTLVGVGGLIGVHRTVNADALGAAARTGSLAHILFPRNPVADAPAILNDLGTIFTPARGRTIVGPMAKLGWGTPTLITADLGILIEFPGPRIAVLGVVRMKLPNPNFAILSLQLAIVGLIDFPAQLFSLDAGLFDSYVAGFAVSGDMAFRLGFGENTQFLLSVGGFNPGFAPPPRFPTLRRASVDLGVNGNPSLTASGYFALSSNTAQIGASVELRASGYGIRLHGWLGFDVLFVFSPFSFVASISAGVRVSFHGVGMGITLRGSLSGPTPWRLDGKVCVSVLWWDACLPVRLTFGRQEPAALPELDPWEVVGGEVPTDDPRLNVVRLRPAIEDPRNWAGSAPPAGFGVVTLAAAATLERTPIDPLGAATLRQRIAPLNRVLEKFGEYKPINHDHFNLTSVLVNDDELVSQAEPVLDRFAPAHFEDLSSAEKLKAGAYEDMTAGFEIAPDRIRTGTAGSHLLEYETALITETGERVDQSDQPHRLTVLQLLAMLERCASALAGIRQAGLRRYAPLPGQPKLVTLTRVSFVVVDACSHVVAPFITPTRTSGTNARLALKAYVRQNPNQQNQFTVIKARAA
jgi:hypothetical protein